MKIKVSSSYTGVISTGSYENSRPGFAAEVEMEYPEGLGKEESIALINDAQKALQETCYNNFKAVEMQSILERIEKERQDIRWYGVGANRVPSVTSIINWDKDFYQPPHQLAQYAAQGQVIDLQSKHFIKTGKLVEPKEISEAWPYIVILKKGDLALPIEGWDFPGFLNKYPIKDLKVSESGVNMEHRYGGTPDCEGIPDFKDADPVPTMFDIKRTADKVEHFKQIAAYCKLKGNEHIKQMGIIPINDKTAQGFSKPIIETRIDEYFNLFLIDRENFKKRFGI